jgi:chorismate lyase/3-hydroxybenzoate synthase
MHEAFLRGTSAGTLALPAIVAEEARAPNSDANATGGAIRVDLTTHSGLAQIAGAEAHILARIGYSEGAGEVHADSPLITVKMPQLGPKPLTEVWTSRTPVVTGRRGNLVFAENGAVLFGFLEARLDGISFDQAAYQAYGQILTFIRKRCCPHLLRMWNYFPGINEAQATIERYKLFCIGRHQAFEEHGSVFSRDLPAASAVGTHTGPLVILFLAAAQSGAPIENPRQVPAYSYPRQYGPRSPAFARATLIDWNRLRHLYISGTASIVGYRSTHPDDAVAQLVETMENFRALLKPAALSCDDLAMLKVYLRHPRHYRLVRRRLEAELGTDVPVLYLTADLCRQELLLEIEAMCVRKL